MEPLKFNALLKSTIWGGEKIIPFKHLDVQQENVGESWEISGVPGNETVVANGEYRIPSSPTISKNHSIRGVSEVELRYFTLDL